MHPTTRTRRPPVSSRLLAPAIALILAVTIAGPARADQASANQALTTYTAGVDSQTEPTPEMLDEVTRRLLEALPREGAKALVIDRMLSAVDDPTTSAAYVMVLDELGLPRGELLAAAVDRLSHDDVLVSDGAAAYVAGHLVRPEIDIDTKLLVLELLEPAAAHAAPLASSLLALQLIQHGRNTPSMISAIDRLLATALPDDAARITYGVPGLVELARSDDGNLRGLAMLKLGQWKIATPAAVDMLLENATYTNDDARLAKRVRIVAVQTLGDLVPGIVRLDPTLGFRVQRELVSSAASEPDEGLRDLIVHVSTKMGSAIGKSGLGVRSKAP